MSDSRPDVLVLHVSAPQMVAALAEHFMVHVVPDTGDRTTFIAQVAPRVRGLVVTTFVGADAQLINGLPNLEIVVNAGGHYHSTDVAAVRAHGLPMAYTPRVTTEDVADALLALLLAAARRLAEGDRFVRSGSWRRGPMGVGVSVNGKRLGIVGLGHIGRAVARRATAFDMDVHYYGPRRHDDIAYTYWADLVAMAQAVDVLVVTCRTEPATRHIVNAAALEALGPDGIVVSVARLCIDEAALVDALTHGRIAATGLDVFEDEPIVPKAFLGMDNVVLTPHIGSATTEAKETMVRLVVANLRAHFEGRPLLTPVD